MQKFLWIALLVIVSGYVYGQEESSTLDFFEGMTLRHVGPSGTSGRVTSIDVVHKNPEIIYAGTASGGLWKSVSGGIKWTPIFDEQSCSSIGAVCIDQNNPSVIWAGTGEGNPRNSQSSGCGIYKSIDGGNSWEFMGLENSKTIHRIIIHKDDPNVVFVGATGSAWGPNEERGVFKTSDGGLTWEKVLYVNDQTGCADLIVHPENPNMLVAAMWEYGRKPWFFESGGEGSGLYISFDGGNTWEERTEEDGLPKGNLGRIGLTNSADEPNLIYALVEAETTGLYKSENNGFDWQLISTENIGNRPFYYADIQANPQDANEIWNLWSMVSKSEDGGRTFKTIINYSSGHPDHHAFFIHPDDPNFMIDGNDGGMNISRDGGKSWEFVHTLPLGQFYHINYDLETPYNIMGGMQDNGSWVGPAYVWHSGGIRNNDWKEVLFGDGFDVMPNLSNSDEVYAMYQGGNVSRVNKNTGSKDFIKPIESDKNLRFNWNSPIAKDPSNSKGLYFGSQYLHHSDDQGLSWKIISPDLTSNDTTKQKQALSGGLTIDATQAENYTSLTCIEASEISSDEGKVIWTGSDDGKVYLTRDKGENWVEFSKKLKDLPEGSWITQITCSKINPGEAFIVANDYRRNNWEPYAYHTDDYGKSWNRIINGSKVSGHAHCIAQDFIQENLLFLGTENGLWVSFDYGKSWDQWTENYSPVPTIDLKIHPIENDLIIGTFGRAAYVLDDIGPLRARARSIDEFDEAKIQLFDLPAAYHVAFSRPNGPRFTADHEWYGDNRSSGLRIQYAIHSEVSEDSETKDTITFHVLNGMDTLRSWQNTNVVHGINQSNWWLDTKGFSYPSRRERKKEEEKFSGGGPTISPGTYTLLADYKDVQIQKEFEVRFDPRMEVKTENIESRTRFIANHREYVETADHLFNQLKEAKNSIDLVKKNLAVYDSDDFKSIVDTASVLIKRIAELESLFMLPENFKGYQHVEKRLVDHLWNVRSYIGEAWNGPLGNSAAEANLKAKNEVEKVQSEVEDFLTKDFNEWREKVVEINFNPFNKIE